MGQTAPVSTIIMKSLILLAVVAFASAVPTCDECLSAVQGFKDHLLTAESLAEQQAILVLAACPQAPDPAQCEEWVGTYWEGIATVLFDWLINVKEPCGDLGLGLCKRDFTCDDCLGALNKLGEIMIDETYIAEGVAYMQGPAYWERWRPHTRLRELHCGCSSGCHGRSSPGVASSGNRTLSRSSYGLLVLLSINKLEIKKKKKKKS